MKRGEILDQALRLVTADREEQHGRPEATFGMIAMFWSAYLGTSLTSADVCTMMALLKIARGSQNVDNMDNYVDGAGYLSLAGELIGK